MRRWIDLCESFEPWDDIAALIDSHPTVDAGIDFDGDSTLNLSSLEAQYKGEGAGTAFMRELCKLADQHDLYINLEPSGYEDDRAHYERLVNFYARFGFREISDGVMTRAPGTTPVHFQDSKPDSLINLQTALERDGLQHIAHAPEQWLVHFTGYAEEISRDGFTRGTPLNHIGWKGAWGRDSNQPGFNFACAAHDEQALEFWSQHVPCAVVFKAEGVTCWHKDGFDQVIFWGPSAKRPIYVIDAEYGPTATPADDSEWTVKMKDGVPVEGHVTGDMWTVLRKITGILAT